MSLARIAVYSFLCLPIPKRYVVLDKFNLSEYAKGMMNNNTWLFAVMSKVIERNLLNDFIEEIRSCNKEE